MPQTFCKYVNYRPFAIPGQGEVVSGFCNISPLELALERPQSVATRRRHCGDRQHGNSARTLNWLELRRPGSGERSRSSPLPLSKFIAITAGTATGEALVPCSVGEEVSVAETSVIDALNSAPDEESLAILPAVPKDYS